MCKQGGSVFLQTPEGTGYTFSDNIEGRCMVRSFPMHGFLNF